MCSTVAACSIFTNREQCKRGSSHPKIEFSPPLISSTEGFVVSGQFFILYEHEIVCLKKKKQRVCPFCTVYVLDLQNIGRCLPHAAVIVLKLISVKSDKI